MVINNKTYIYMLMYIFSILIPMEAYFNVGNVRVELYRILLLLVTPYVFINLNKNKLIGLKEKLLFVFCIYVGVSFYINHGFVKIESGIINFLEVFIGYGLGLLLLGDKNVFKNVFKVFLIVFLTLIPFAVYEAIDGVRFLHIIAADIFGNPVVEELGDSYFRHGIHRASTLFSHPILYSICGVMLFPILFIYFRPLKAVVMGAGILVAMITSVTSAGFLMIAFQFSLYLLKRLSFYIDKIYKIIFITMILLYVFLVISSNRGPILILIQTLALNPATAYARYQQWQFSIDDISSNPFFGIGFHNWSRPFWMSSSVDSFWLNTTLISGYPSLILLLSFFFLSLKEHWSKKDNKSNGHYHFAFFCSISSILFAGLTVDFFDRAQLMVFFIMGIYNSFLLNLNKETKK